MSESALVWKRARFAAEADQCEAARARPLVNDRKNEHPRTGETLSPQLCLFIVYYLSLKTKTFEGKYSVFGLFRSYCPFLSRITLLLNQQ